MVLIIINQMDGIETTQMIMDYNYNGFWLSLLYLSQCVYLYLAKTCHPWWLVAGSIPVMPSHGYGFGD